MLLLWWVTSISEVVVVDFKKCLTAIVVKSLRIYCWFQRMSNNLQSYYVTMSYRVDMWQCHKTFQYGIGFITTSKNPVSWASFTLSVWFLSYSSVEISINFSGFSLTFQRTFSNFLWYFSLGVWTFVFINCHNEIKKEQTKTFSKMLLNPKL